MINLSNYEDWFLLYADGELTVAEQEAVLKFVKQNPSLQEEFDLMMGMRFQPETEIKFADHSTLTAEYFNELENTYRFEPDLSIQFPNKENLYKRTAAPVISMFRFAAVAASTIVTAGLIWWFVGTNSVDQTLVKTEVNVTPEVNSIEPINNLPQTNNTNSSVSKVNATNQVAFVVNRKPVAGEGNEQKYIVEPPVEEGVKEFVAREQIAAPVYTEQPRSNFSQEAIQAAQARINETPSTATPVYTSSPINTALLIEAEMDSEKQVRGRGILRKISRTLLGERKEEDDNQKYIQLAVFSIPVQK
ncbi:MAG: hypothetical protein RL713_1661 [Bacteroidota bacterium]|jgi:hypothetical protein